LARIVRGGDGGKKRRRVEEMGDEEGFNGEEGGVRWSRALQSGRDGGVRGKGTESRAK
jgi:hypothetical protein